MTNQNTESIREQLREAERKVTFWKKNDPLPKFMKDLEDDVERLKAELIKTYQRSNK